jgi:hypothetical protein
MLSVAAFVVNLFASPLPVAPCDLVAAATANELLGARAGAPESMGPEQDEDIPGATRSVCIYMAGTRMPIVMEHTFRDAKSARDAMTQEAIRAQHEEEPGLTIKDEPGLGDKAYWVVLKGGAQYVVIKGAKVLSVLLGGVAK